MSPLLVSPGLAVIYRESRILHKVTQILPIALTMPSKNIPVVSLALYHFPACVLLTSLHLLVVIGRQPHLQTGAVAPYRLTKFIPTDAFVNRRSPYQIGDVYILSDIDVYSKPSDEVNCNARMPTLE